MIAGKKVYVRVDLGTTEDFQVSQVVVHKSGAIRLYDDAGDLIRVYGPHGYISFDLEG